jgi:hypothetical protein
MREANLHAASKKSGAMTADVYTPKYEFFQQLEFLRPAYKKRTSKTNVVRFI